MTTVAVLEGEYIDDDFIGVFDDMGWNVYPIEQLYYLPDRLDILPELDPEYVYIRTTGIDMGGRREFRKTLVNKFLSLEWIPKNVIFFNEDSVMPYLKVCKHLKSKGTKFYLIPFKADEMEDREITWI